MKIEVQSIHFDADKKLLDFIDDRLNKLDNKYDSIIDGTVFLRLDRASNNENKIVEIRLNIPKTELFAKKQCKSFEEAVDEASEALRRQLKKHKEKVLGI